MEEQRTRSGEIHELASSYAIGALDEVEQERFERHLRRGCEICEAALLALSGITGGLAETVAADPPAALRARILDRVSRSPRKPGVMLDEGGLLISRAAELPWRRLAEGIVYKPLFTDTVRRYSTTLVRMEAGARYAGHRHEDVEELFVLSGDLHVAGEVMRPGDYCRAGAQSLHGETYTESGCTILLMASLDNVMLP